jgi:nucleoside-diphosphate-sugar epimerase
MASALITGASGFIGWNLARRLVEQGDHVACLVRDCSRRERLEPLGVEFRRGDILDPASLTRAVEGVDVVYHLAGLTTSLSAAGLNRVNGEGTAYLAEACARRTTPPTLIVTSSIAAAGPSRGDRPIVESDEPRPVSRYGASKLEGERAAARWADRAPISILRPPIVLGEGDRAGRPLFASIANWGVHLTPVSGSRRYSVIHAADLSIAFTLIAAHGKRIASDQEKKKTSSGIYFAASDSPTYAELGGMIAELLGVRRLRVWRNSRASVWALCAGSEAWSQIRRRASVLNLD